MRGRDAWDAYGADDALRMGLLAVAALCRADRFIGSGRLVGWWVGGWAYPHEYERGLRHESAGGGKMQGGNGTESKGYEQASEKVEASGE